MGSVQIGGRPNIQTWDWSGFAADPPPIDWLIEGVLSAGGACDIYGPPGSRKSTIAYHLAATIAAGGGKWFGWQVAGGRVAIIGGESSSRDAHWRMAHRVMGLAGREIDPQRLITIPNRPILRWARGYVTDGRQEGWDITPIGHAVIEYLREYQPRLVIIDTILAGAHGCNVLDQAQQYALAEELGRIASDLTTTIMTASHTNQASMGSSIRLDSRLHYTARSGSNGGPGAWRWMAGVTTLRGDDKKYLGSVVANLNLDSGMFFAVGASKHNEIEPPTSVHYTSPAIFEVRAGQIALVADGLTTRESIQAAASQKRGTGRRGSSDRRAAITAAAGAYAKASGAGGWQGDQTVLDEFSDAL